MNNTINISVRALVEFLLKEGDINASKDTLTDTKAMLMGGKLHRKIQKRMGSNYSSEVTLKHSTKIEYDGVTYEIIVDGRADGIIMPMKSEKDLKSYAFSHEGNYLYTDKVIIDEIKCVMGDISHINKPINAHLAQAKCYAYFWMENMRKVEGENVDEAPETYDETKQNRDCVISASSNNTINSTIVVRLTYCQMKSEEIKYFHQEFNFKELESFYDDLMRKYVKWVNFQVKWNNLRNESARKLEFPFEYRQGQKKLAQDVYRTILRKKKLYLQAPTGVGKTISTTFPGVKAMGEELLSKIFYLTARTTQGHAAVNSFEIMENKGLKIKVISLTAKEKMCILEKSDCNPVSCERAKGHFDRVNDAVFDLINNETKITRNVLFEYATKHKVCPFEFALDVSIWCDVVVGDYNYAFDPNVYLRRFFQNDKENDYLFLVDEAHNLVQRARDMYSARLVKEELLLLNSYVKIYDKKLSAVISKCNKFMLELKRKSDRMQVIDYDEISGFVFSLMEIIERMDKLLSGEIKVENAKEARDIYFNIRNFINTYDKLFDDYTVYTDFMGNGDFYISLQCMDPARLLFDYLSKAKSSVFLSATLLPIDYYKEQLAGSEEDYAVYAPSTFSKDNRLIMISNEVTTKYTRRNEREYLKIAGYIKSFVEGKKGNYMIFFPSYKYMEDISKYLDEYREFMVFQENEMSEEKREEFLGGFLEKPKELHIGMAVMGGVFSEGIDLIGDRLIGAVIVGNGFPMVCNERELFKNYFDEKNKNGFDYAYLYDGMNKVQQSVGRVIRTATDKGALLILEERLLNEEYTRLFPREWYPYEVVNLDRMNKLLENFWGTK